MYYDYPDVKLKYKYEKGCSLVSVMSECIVEAPIVDTLSIFAEVDYMKEWMPNLTDVVVQKQVTEYRALYNFRQSVPWPLYPREIQCMATGMYDRKIRHVFQFANLQKEDKDGLDSRFLLKLKGT